MCILYKALTEERVKDKWKQQRNQALPSSSHLVLDHTKKVGGFLCCQGRIGSLKTDSELI